MWDGWWWGGENSMPLFTTRAVLKAMLAAAAGGPVAGRASAQTYPTRPLRLVVPFSPGARILDIMARLISRDLSAALGHQVVVHNKPGAGGNGRAAIVATAAPDDHNR